MVWKLTSCQATILTNNRQKQLKARLVAANYLGFMQPQVLKDATHIYGVQPAASNINYGRLMWLSTR